MPVFTRSDDWHLPPPGVRMHIPLSSEELAKTPKPEDPVYNSEGEEIPYGFKEIKTDLHTCIADLYPDRPRMESFQVTSRKEPYEPFLAMKYTISQNEKVYAAEHAKRLMPREAGKEGQIQPKKPVSTRASLTNIRRSLNLMNSTGKRSSRRVNRVDRDADGDTSPPVTVRRHNIKKTRSTSDDEEESLARKSEGLDDIDDDYSRRQKMSDDESMTPDYFGDRLPMYYGGEY